MESHSGFPTNKLDLHTPKLSIVIPCYNEAENIPILIQRLSQAPAQNTEIILVDNGSTDKTPAVLAKELEQLDNPLIRSLRVERNFGYGFGIMNGVRDAKGDIIAWTHADLQTDINDVFLGYKEIRRQTNTKYNFLKGVRKNRPLIDEFFTWGMGVISSWILGQKLNDINAQPKMFHRSFLDLMHNSPNDFSLDLYVLYLAKKNGMNIIELPVYFKKRLYGVAKGGGGSSFITRLKLLKRTFAYILKLKREIKSGNR